MSKIKQIPAFQTTDGKIFTSIHQADKHQFDILWDEILIDFIRKHIAPQTGVATVECVVNQFVDHKKELQKKINKLTFSTRIE